MSDIGRMKSMLDAGVLLHPISGTFSIVDFASAVHDSMGVPDVPLNEDGQRIRQLIGEPDHLVLVLADGFGMNFIEALDRDAFLPNHLAAEMRTVFPSTTPIVLTTLATGRWPGAHSVIGWFVRLEGIGATSTIISYIRTRDGRALSDLGVRVDDAYPVESRIGKAARAAAHIMPAHITGSIYSNYWTGASFQVGYDAESPEQAVRLALKHVKNARWPTCVYMYLPQVDSLAHKLGAAHEQTLHAARLVDRLLGELADGLPPSSRLVMTADHGHLDAPPDKTYTVGKNDEIGLLGAALTGDQRAVFAHVAAKDFGAFRDAVKAKCGDDFIVLRTGEVEELRLLGPEPVSDETRRRMGGALVLSTGEAVLDYRAVLGDDVHPMASHHGGLTPAEMRIPLVVA